MVVVTLDILTSLFQGLWVFHKVRLQSCVAGALLHKENISPVSTETFHNIDVYSFYGSSLFMDRLWEEHNQDLVVLV